ncbi:MAG: hypothetical protein P8100_11625 [bacterium]|jgi:hypothetical protein
MDKIKLDDALRAVFGELQEYFDLQLKYNKILLAKKMGDLISHLALFVIILGISGFLFLFLSLAFAEWFNEQVDVPYAGHLIVAGFYLLLAVILILFKESLVFNPIRTMLGNIVLGDDDDEDSHEKASRRPEVIRMRLHTYKQLIKKKEERLGEMFDGLSQHLTFTNIVQTIVRNAYTSYVTTSNIVKTAYSLVKRITSRKTHKIKKRKKDWDDE